MLLLKALITNATESMTLVNMQLIIYVHYPADHCLPPRACDNSPNN